METRQDWECLIISCCLLEKEAFLTVSNYLAGNNFKNPLHKKIFETMENLFPMSPINVVSVCSFMTQDEIIQIWDLVANYSCSVGNLKYYAGCILETDLVVGFKAHIERLVKYYYNDPILKIYAPEIEMIGKMTHEWCNVFEIINTSLAFFRTDASFNKAAEETEVFIAKMDKRILLIKAQSKVDSLFHHLSALENIPSSNRLLIHKLAEITKHLANGFSISQANQDSILRLKINESN